MISQWFIKMLMLWLSNTEWDIVSPVNLIQVEGCWFHSISISISSSIREKVNNAKISAGNFRFFPSPVAVNMYFMSDLICDPMECIAMDFPLGSDGFFILH